MADVKAETRVEDHNNDSCQDNEDSAELSEGGASDEPAVKKAKTAKENSINETKTNSNTKDEAHGKRNSRGSSKRGSTLSKVAKEGEALLKEMGHKSENTGSERRQTRSQTRGTPPVASQKSSRQETAKRSRRGRPRKEDKEEDKEEPEKETKVENDVEEKEKNDSLNSNEEKDAVAENTSDGTGEEEESQPETEDINDKPDE